MVRYNHINVKAPLANAFISVGQHTIARIVGYGALAGLTSVVLILMLGQSRVFFAMSRDRLLPPAFSAISERFRTPYRTTLVTGVVVAVLAAVFDINTLSEMVNIGTLFAFMLVSIGVVVLRRTRPDLPRPFRTPLVPVVPALSVLASLWLMLNLESLTWLRFVVWLAIGLVVYFLYGMRHSRLTNGGSGPGDGGLQRGGDVEPRPAPSGVR
jgi:APA family basic amino acid/polyamine antiporter